MARPRRRRRLLVAAGPVLVLVLVTGGLAVRAALAAADHVEQARDGLQAAQADGLDLDQARVSVEVSRARLAAARQELTSPAARVVAAVPVLGRSWNAEAAVVETAAAVLDALSAGLEVAPGLRAESGRLDLVRLDQLGQDLTQLADRAERARDRLDDQPTGWTPSLVREAVGDARSTLGPLVDGVRQAAVGASVAPGLLGGDEPRELLVMLQNNAELRGAGGYAASFTTGRLDGGQVRDLAPLRDVEEVAEPAEDARRVPAPAEYVEDFGPFMADSTLWRTWSMSPDVPDSAAVAAAVAGELLPTRPDAVLLLDVPAMAEVIRVTGQRVRLPDGSEVPSGELTEVLLVDSYARAGDSRADQADRKDALQRAATEALSGLLSSDVPVLEAARALGRLAAERHLVLWSADPEEQAGLVEVGLAGAVDPGDDDLAMVSLNNLNANKLDYYVRREVSVDVLLAPGEAEVVQRVQLSNEAPEDLVPYVAGFQPGERSGTVRWRIEVSTARDADVLEVTLDGEPVPTSVRPGRHRTRVITYASLDRGRSLELVVRSRTPTAGGSYRLHLHPQPLAEDAELDLRVRAAEGSTLREVDGEPVRGGVLERRGPWERSSVLEARIS